MKNPEDFWEVLEVVPGEPLMGKPDPPASSATIPDGRPAFSAPIGRGTGFFAGRRPEHEMKATSPRALGIWVADSPIGELPVMMTAGAAA